MFTYESDSEMGCVTVQIRPLGLRVGSAFGRRTSDTVRRPFPVRIAAMDANELWAHGLLPKNPTNACTRHFHCVRHFARGPDVVYISSCKKLPTSHRLSLK